MNRYDFYDNLDKFKSLQHSSKYGDKYYTKLDNYYSDGSSRYFYTRQEWEAYQKDKGQDAWKKQQVQKKEAENRSGMTGYAEWKKNEDKKKKIEKQKKETIEKNKSASEHEDDRFKKPQQNTKVAEEDKLKKAISSRETAIQKAYKDEQERRKEEKRKQLYEYKDEIVEKADVYLKLADDKLSSFLDKFVGDFPPEFKDKVKKILNEIKDYAEDIVKKINDTGSEELDNIVGLIDKITDKLQDKIDKYSKELSDMYQNFKDKINPVFKDEDGNINWKLFLPLAAGLGTIGYIIENPETCFEIFSKIYDTGKKVFNFVDEKTNGKFSAALKEMPKQIDKYIAYKNFEDKGFGKFSVDDGKGGRMTYLDKAYNNYLEATDGYGFATLLTDILFK